MGRQTPITRDINKTTQAKRGVEQETSQIRCAIGQLALQVLVGNSDRLAQLEEDILDAGACKARHGPAVTFCDWPQDILVGGHVEGKNAAINAFQRIGWIMRRAVCAAGKRHDQRQDDALNCSLVHLIPQEQVAGRPAGK